MSNTGIYQWFCLWRWWKMSNSGCVFCFFCVFYLSDKQILSKCRDLHGCISGIRCVYFHSGVRFLLADLSCLQLGHLSATQLKQVIMLSMCESPLPTADTQTYLFWLRAEWLWNISFHFRPAAVNGACVNTQGSVSKSFCALEFPSTMVYKENVSHGTLLLPLGSRVHHLSTSKKIFHSGFYPQKQMLRQL